MSKRFGRNQKRRMRQQIEQLEKDLHNHKCWLFQERKLSARNREIVAETAQVLGRDFMTLDPMEQEVRDLDALMPTWRVHFPGTLDCTFDPIGREPQYAEFTDIALQVLQGSARVDNLSRAVHMRFTFHGEQVGYGITLESLQRLPREWAARRMAREMTEQLMNELWRAGA